MGWGFGILYDGIYNVYILPHQALRWQSGSIFRTQLSTFHHVRLDGSYPFLVSINPPHRLALPRPPALPRVSSILLSCISGVSYIRLPLPSPSASYCLPLARMRVALLGCMTGQPGGKGRITLGEGVPMVQYADRPSVKATLRLVEAGKVDRRGHTHSWGRSSFFVGRCARTEGVHPGGGNSRCMGRLTKSGIQGNRAG